VSNQADKLRNLQADLAICEAATPGPWKVDKSLIEIDGYTLFISYCATPRDLRFAAEAREGWPHAIRRALTAEARVAELERELKRLKGGECSCPGSA
jgi:hypothetical protein